MFGLKHVSQRRSHQHPSRRLLGSHPNPREHSSTNSVTASPSSACPFPATGSQHLILYLRQGHASWVPIHVSEWTLSPPGVPEGSVNGGQGDRI